jgi:hypothetical protein
MGPQTKYKMTAKTYRNCRILVHQGAIIIGEIGKLDVMQAVQQLYN